MDSEELSPSDAAQIKIIFKETGVSLDKKHCQYKIILLNIGHFLL